MFIESWMNLIEQGTDNGQESSDTKKYIKMQVNQKLRQKTSQEMADFVLQEKTSQVMLIKKPEYGKAFSF